MRVPRRLRPLLRSAQAFWSRDPMTLAASIAFYTSLSFAPLLTLAVVGFASLGGEFQAAFLRELRDILGPQVAEAANVVLKRIDGDAPDSATGWLALGTVLFSASAVFGQLQSAINHLWDAKDREHSGWRAWLHHRLVSFGMLIGLGLLLLSTFIASSLLAALFAASLPWVMAASEVLATALIATAFALMFRYVPYVRPGWRRCLRAGIATALLFQAGKWALSLYFARAGLSDAYGPAGAVVLLMVWSFYVSLLILVGSALARPPTEPAAGSVEA